MKHVTAVILMILILFTGCSTMKFSEFSRSMDVAKEVDLEKYLGSWYEFARLDVIFERGMTGTTANYSLLEPDKKGRPRIRVVNSGIKNGKQKEARAKAILPDINEPGRLQVSFFGPFYSDYNIIALDSVNYQWALVAGSSTEYLWFLSRTPQMETAVFEKLKAVAESYGFETSDLIFPQ
ncbi:MAG: lipocalin family protein [FCB group bacterium]|nr:lipocalin family protein [FCB group bacterium]